MHNFGLTTLLLFIGVALYSMEPWPFLMLTIAQLVYVPIVLRLVVKKDDWFSKIYIFIGTPAYLAIALLQLFSSKWDFVLAGIYLLFTVFIALYGLTRFLSRGFQSLEEFSIDLGLMYLVIGGGWYFAYVVGIDTGFSPLITWLTAIHFHYSAFLLPIFTGFLGRTYKSKFYNMICSILLVSPLIVAIGITFSRWLELLSTILYLLGVAGLIFIAWKAPFSNWLQKWLVRILFTALGVTIPFSLFYALGNGFGLTSMTIDFMLRFHGVLNCIVFGLFGIIAWSLSVPTPTFQLPAFPVGQLRGIRIAEKLGGIKNHRGLVDDMDVYGLRNGSISPHIVDFYENTIDYRLFAIVKWRRWFRPFAHVYKLVSRYMQQINLPISNRQVEMTGDILTLQDELDGRDQVRAWIRKIGDDTAFVALYSNHVTDGRTYMNISLPLPLSSMIGILELNSVGDGLQLTSKRVSSNDSDAGIYLAFGKNRLFKLPIEEDFLVSGIDNGELTARHTMWLFSIPFLVIDYSIHRN